MTKLTPEERENLRQKVRKLCSEFPDSYRRKLDLEREYPYKFAEACSILQNCTN